MSQTELIPTQIHNIAHIAYEAVRVIEKSMFGNDSSKSWMEIDSSRREELIEEAKQVLSNPELDPNEDELSDILKHTIIHTFRKQITG